jgi:hypothetical protein
VARACGHSGCVGEGYVLYNVKIDGPHGPSRLPTAVLPRGPSAPLRRRPPGGVGRLSARTSHRECVLHDAHHELAAVHMGVEVTPRVGRLVHLDAVPYDDPPLEDLEDGVTRKRIVEPGEAVA